jgi:ribose transport system ATP-binding protein
MTNAPSDDPARPIPQQGRGPLLETVALTKHYPGVKALDGVDFSLAAGEVHVLFGENGAGKSTLITLLAGASQPSSGRIVMEGHEVHLHSVLDARKHGVSAVFQEFSLVPTLTVAENLFLGDESPRHGFIDRRALASRARALLADLQFDLDPARRVSSLTRAEQQMVEIAKGFRSRLRVLILDEPTASLTDRETERLFALVARIKAEGAGVIYITHRMQEIARIGDRVTVLRDGRRIGTVDAKSTSGDRLIEMMTGRTISEIYPTIESRPGEVLLEVDRLRSGAGVHDASITVRRGEVVGLAGLVGSGKSELMRAVFGIDRVVSGRVRFKGVDVTHASPGEMLERGLFYLPPDRKAEGLVLPFTARANIALPALRTKLRGLFGLLSGTRREALTRSAAQQVELAESNVGRAVAVLSGGNQQKVLFAKGLGIDADLYVLDEPTVGVDVGTRSALYALIKRLCEGGAGVVLVSSDLPEVLHLSHRVYVTRRGYIAGERHGAEINEASLLGLFFERDRAAA